MPKSGDIIAAKYEIEQLIGVGGMGAVFSAVHRYTGKRVALKWMLPELASDEDAVQRFMREARAAGRINHPNVVDVYDVGQHDSSYFLVMEFLQGEPLTSALVRRDLTPSELLVLLLPALRGVAAAHRQGVIHRDLKPDNIFLAYEEDGVRREAKVLDFGISKLASDDQPNMHLTRTGAVIGTPFYMSPEQIRGTGTLDRRADIYAWGVILYEALGGQVPFSAETYGALVLEIATGTPRPLYELRPGLPVELSNIVLRAMARDANARFSSMEELVAALEPYARPSMSGAGYRAGQRVGSDRPPNQPGFQPNPYQAAYQDPYAQTTPNPARFPQTPVRRAPSALSTPRAPSQHAATGAATAAFEAEPGNAPGLYTTTPFGAEASRRQQQKPSQLLGIVAVAAALLIMGVAWYMTREPEHDATPTAPPTAAAVPGATSGEGKSAAAPGSEDLPRGLSPAAASVPTDAIAPAARHAEPSGLTVEPANVNEYGRGEVRRDESEVSPVAPQRVNAAGSRRDQREQHKAGHGSRRTSEPESPPRRSVEVQEQIPAAPTQAAPEASKPTPQQRARSGTLNVNEF